MTRPRLETVTTIDGDYHCMARCVRRAHLCGYDALTKRSYEHRKEWIRARLQYLLEIFCIDLLAHAVMGNHLHTMLRLRPDKLLPLSNFEVARRWLKLYPPGAQEPKEDQIEALAQNEDRIAVIRSRLGSLSWFNKSLNEYIARRANIEDECKGRFWEGRFKCKRICDQAARLACSIYIDLNPIHAQVATTPEESRYTSAWERIELLKRDPAGKFESSFWLSPISEFLTMSLPEYLMLLDATGRHTRADKPGAIPPHLAPILTRLGIRPEAWIDTIKNFDTQFGAFVGSRQSLEEAATATGKSWLKGFTASRRAFQDTAPPCPNVAS